METKEKKLVCPKCGTDIEFSPPTYCPECKAIVIPQLLFLVECLHPIDGIMRKFESLKIRPSLDKMSIAEYVSKIRELSSNMLSELEEIDELINTKYGATLVTRSKKELETLASDTVMLVDRLYKIHDDFTDINPPERIMSYDFEEFHNNSMGMFKPVSTEVFNVYKTLVDVAKNPERYIKDNQILLDFVFSVDYNKFDKSRQILKEITRSIEDLHPQLWHKLLELTPREFEIVIADLFKLMGYKVKLTPEASDFGADLVARKDEDIVVVQAKRYSAGNNVGNQEVQKTLGSMWRYGANKAVLVTTSDFTVLAKEQAKGAPIELWNMKMLINLLQKYHKMITGNSSLRAPSWHSPQK